MNNTLFYKKVDRRKRTDMIDFLRNHFRYDTMNSWNRATSYANNVKLYNLNLPEDINDTAYEICLSEISDNPLNDAIDLLLDDFFHETGYRARFNGKSGGYLVLYYTQLERDYNTGEILYRTYPGRGIDEDDDFEEWDINQLRDRTLTVQRFDKLCDDIRNTLIDICRDFNVTEKTITVEKKIKCLEPKNAEQGE